MAESIRVAATATPIVTNGVLSAARGGHLVVRFAGVPDIGQLLIVFGLASGGPPGTYGDYDSSDWQKVPCSGGASEVTYSPDSGGLYSGSVSFPIAGGVWAEGTMYVSLFAVTSIPPDPTDAPAAVGPGFTIAP